MSAMISEEGSESSLDDLETKAGKGRGRVLVSVDVDSPDHT